MSFGLPDPGAVQAPALAPGDTVLFRGFRAPGVGGTQYDLPAVVLEASGPHLWVLAHEGGYLVESAPYAAEPTAHCWTPRPVPEPAPAPASTASSSDAAAGSSSRRGAKSSSDTSDSP